MSLPNCDICGKFVGWKKPYVEWVPYGTCLDYEPPDPEFAHLVCWEADPTLQRLITSTSWGKPQILGAHNGTSE